MDLDFTSRDDTPAMLLGLQEIHRNRVLCAAILSLLETHLLLDSAAAGGDQPAARHRGKINPRTGMSLWSVLVLAILKQGLNCEYDRLHDLVRNHREVRCMMGLSDMFTQPLVLYRTVMRNVSLVTPELLADINQIVVQAEHQLVGHEPHQPLHARCDSFVVETHVEGPTDMGLSWDALR